MKGGVYSNMASQLGKYTLGEPPRLLLLVLLDGSKGVPRS